MRLQTVLGNRGPVDCSLLPLRSLAPPPHDGAAGADALARFRAALATVAAAAPPAIAGRLTRLTTAGKKAKTHTFFLLASPYGAYAVVSAGLDRDVEEAMLRLLNACCNLWDKVQDSRKVEELRMEVAEAVSHVELHMSATELDIKLHNLIHLADGIRNLGEALGCSSAPGHQHGCVNMRPQQRLLLPANHVVW